MIIEGPLTSFSFIFFIKELVKILELENKIFFKSTYFLWDNLSVHYSKSF